MDSFAESDGRYFSTPAQLAEARWTRILFHQLSNGHVPALVYSLCWSQCRQLLRISTQTVVTNWQEERLVSRYALTSICGEMTGPCTLAIGKIVKRECSSARKQTEHNRCIDFLSPKYFFILRAKKREHSRLQPTKSFFVLTLHYIDRILIFKDSTFPHFLVIK